MHGVALLDLLENLCVTPHLTLCALFSYADTTWWLVHSEIFGRLLLSRLNWLQDKKFETVQNYELGKN